MPAEAQLTEIDKGLTVVSIPQQAGDEDVSVPQAEGHFLFKDRAMPTEKKVQIVERLQDIFSRSTIFIVTDYRGLSATEMTRLRHQLSAQGVGYQVVKNTLARFAAERVGKTEFKGLLQGPVAIAFGYGDVTEPARYLTDYIRTSKISLPIRGGLLEGRILSPEGVSLLSSLPCKEDLVAKLVGRMQVPVSALLNVLTSHLRGLTVVLQARIQQLEGG